MAKETLLIVEDNATLRDGLRDILSYEGFTVLTAANGKEALQLMSAVSPELILSDITMPEMDGFAFFSAVRDRPEWVVIPFIFLTARGDKEDIITGKNLGAEDYLIKPINREELVTVIRSRLTRSQQIQAAELQRAMEASLTVLANSIELRDSYTRGHVERVLDYAITLAVNMGWQERRLEPLRYGAILHDIGKIFTPENTLKKISPLTNEDWAIIKRHPVQGANLIEPITYLAPAAPIVRHHHERWDGAGYPDGLKKEEIPIGARIVAVADSFDAITTIRHYSMARSLVAGYEEILRCSGQQYDPGVIAAFQRAWNTGQIQTISRKWEKEIWIS